MPKQLGSTLMFTIFLVAIAVAVNRAEENTVPGDGLTRHARGPASIAERHAPVSESDAFRHTAKLHGPVTTKIEMLGEPPSAAGDVFTLRGEVVSDQDLDQVAYRWSLPGNVELIGGVATGQIDHLRANVAYFVELTLRSHDASNAQVHLLATAFARGARFAESAQFNTVMQAEFAKSRARLSKSTQDNAASRSSTRGLKVMH